MEHALWAQTALWHTTKTVVVRVHRRDLDINPNPDRPRQDNDMILARDAKEEGLPHLRDDKPPRLETLDLHHLPDRRIDIHNLLRGKNPENHTLCNSVGKMECANYSAETVDR